MDKEKIGKFILELRKEKNLTQEELAELIPIDRGAISKWERCITIPDSSTLLILSRIFDVSINEILCGQRLTAKEEKYSSNILTLELYDKNIKRKKIIMILIFIIMLLFLLFLTYYFINSYKSIKVFTINGIKNDLKILDGIFVKTKHKLYFKVEVIDNTINNINDLTIYYVTNQNEEIMIANNKGDYVSFIDYNGYNEYIDSSNIDYILKNLYIKITYANDYVEKIKLDLYEDYVNDNFIFNKKQNIEKQSNNDSQLNLTTDTQNLIDKIKNTFNFQDNNYVYETLKNNQLVNVIFFADSNTLTMNIVNKDENESWYYDLFFKNIIYTNSKNNYSFSYSKNEFNCLQGICNNQEEKIKKFWLELDTIL